MKQEIINRYLEMEDNLSIYAARSKNTILNKRLITESECIDRLDFQRDRDRIIHSRCFRRLMHKTQVFNANVGDHYRNRLTHSLEVCQIARSISKLLGLNDELTEAIALGHDVGHTPFGHIGERTLHMILSGKLSNFESGLPDSNFGGFKHNFQSLQLIDNLEKRSNDYKGLNLSFAVREGIFKHTGEKIKVPIDNHHKRTTNFEKEKVKYISLNLENMRVGQPSITLEGQVVGIADEIAQCTHDLEDGIRSKIINYNDLENNDLIKKIYSMYEIELQKFEEVVDFRNTIIRQLVGYLINDVYINSSKVLSEKLSKERVPKFTNYEDVYKEQYISFTEEGTNVKKMQKKLSNLITRLVIVSQQVTQSDVKSEYIIVRLYKAYYNHPQQLPDYILKRYYNRMGREFNRLNIDSEVLELQNDPEFNRLICDHISGMSDQYASREYKKLYEPEYY